MYPSRLIFITIPGSQPGKITKNSPSRAIILVLSPGIEPGSWDPQSHVISVELREQ